MNWIKITNFYRFRICDNCSGFILTQSFNLNIKITQGAKRNQQVDLIKHVFKLRDFVCFCS